MSDKPRDATPETVPHIEISRHELDGMRARDFLWHCYQRFVSAHPQPWRGDDGNLVMQWRRDAALTREPAGWRPIETAAPDLWKTRALLFYPVKGHRVQPTVLLGPYDPDAKEQPTHWQPLPEGPR